MRALTGNLHALEYRGDCTIKCIYSGRSLAQPNTIWNRRSALRSSRTAAVARVWRPRRRAIASQLPATTQPPAYVSRISRTQEGVPENRARAMAQTPDGYLWLGTSGGLARFDGVRFVV